MADTGTTAPSSGYTTPRPFRRVRQGEEGRIVAGLAGGLGRYTDVDPVIFRVLFGALTFVGGLGFALYGLGWLLVPSEGSTESRFATAMHRLWARAPWVIWTIVAILVVSAVSDAHLFWGPEHGFFSPPVLLIVLLVLLFRRSGPWHRGDWHGHRREWREHRAEWQSPTPPTTSTTTGFTAGATTGASMDASTDAQVLDGETTTASFSAAPATTTFPPVSARDRKRPRPSRALLPTFATVAAVWAVLALLGTTDTISISPVGVVVATMVTLSAGLVLSAFVGRSILLVLAELVAIAALVFTIALPAGIGWGVGNQSWAPQAVDELPRTYSLAAGQATLDLTRTQGLQGRTIRAKLGVGELIVEVPANLPVQLHGKVAGGTLSGNGREWEGVGLDRRELLAGTDPTLSPLTLEIEVGYGKIWIRHVTAASPMDGSVRAG